MISRTNTLKGFFIGIFTTLITCGLVLTAIAQSDLQKIEVLMGGVKIFVDGAPFTPQDANGKIVEPLIYQGTTYLPLRAVSTAIKKEVSWDKTNKAVYLGKNNTQTANSSIPKPSSVVADSKGNKNPIVTIEMSNGKTITAELYPDLAPNTVNNFISLIKKEAYKGTIFHRVIPGFMIQGGDPLGNGLGGPGYAIKGEFSANGFKNELKHSRGVLSMARTMNNDSAGSQFFIMVDDGNFLDGQYAAFGKVIDGMSAVDEIVNLPRDSMDRPLQPPIMKSVRIDTKGTTYPEPTIIKTE